VTAPQPTPKLRQGPPPSATSGRKVLIGVAAFFLVLVTFVLVLVFTIGLHNHGVKSPPGPPTKNSSKP
jgi:hypothetical protein